MRSLSKSAIFIGTLTLAAVGCSSGSSSLPKTTVPAASDQGKNHPQSWMLREASSEDLLYIDDPVIGGIDVYSYTPPRYRLVGILAFPNDSRNLCVDRAQDVFATGENTIVEYRHGATAPSRILAIRGAPYGCAVDAVTGTLAVPKEKLFPGPISEVAFFKKGRGTPTNIVLPESYRIAGYCAYDRHGNLFVGANTGLRSSDRFALLELPKNRKKFVPISLGGAFGDAYNTGGIVWDGNYLDIADSEKNIVYQFAIVGHAGVRAARIVLQRSYDIGGFFVEGTTLVIPAYIRPTPPSQLGVGIVNLYNYPAGGKRTSVIHGVSYPLSLVVSLAETRVRRRTVTP